LVKATEAAEVVRADVLLARVRGIEAEARRLGRKAEREGDLRAALLALREMARANELLGRLAGAFHQPEPRTTRTRMVQINSDGTQTLLEIAT
jgi:hypothetical protein